MNNYYVPGTVLSTGETLWVSLAEGGVAPVKDLCLVQHECAALCQDKVGG